MHWSKLNKNNHGKLHPIKKRCRTLYFNIFASEFAAKPFFPNTRKNKYKNILFILYYINIL